MNNILITTLIFLSLMLILNGCGGSDGVSQAGNVSSVKPSENIAYVTLKVKWPENGLAGSVVISSGADKEEINSCAIPNGTQKIDVRIFDCPSENDVIDFGNTDKLLGKGDISFNTETITIPVPVAVHNDPNDPNSSNILPSLPVKIWVGAFNNTTETDPARVLVFKEHWMVLRLGNNSANIILPNYYLTLKSDPNTIVLDNPYFSSSSIVGPPPGSSDITASLMFGSPNDPNNPLRPIEGKSIKFNVESGSGSLSSYNGVTDNNGNLKVTLTSGNAGSIKIKSEFLSDENDPNTSYTAFCDVNVIVSDSPKNEYSLRLASNRNPIIIDPNFVSPTRCLPPDESQITATLTRFDKNSSAYVPVSGKSINFKTIDKDKMTTASCMTDGNGEAQIMVTSNGDGSARTIGVTAEFQKDPADPNSFITGAINIDK